MRGAVNTYLEGRAAIQRTLTAWRNGLALNFNSVNAKSCISLAPIVLYNYLIRGYREERVRLFSEIYGERIRGHNTNCSKGNFSLDIRKKKMQC